jgi:hypothetical protein
MTVSHGLFLEQRRVTEEEQLTNAVTMQKSAGRSFVPASTRLAAAAFGGAD